MKIIYTASIILLSTVTLLAKDYQKSEKMINNILSNNYSTGKQTENKNKKNHKEEKKRTKQSSPKEDEVLYKTGVELFEGGYYDHSASNFKDLTSKFPNSIYSDNANLYLGKIEIKRFKYDTAQNFFSKIKKDSGEYPASLFYSAQALDFDKKYLGAIELFSKVSASFPDHELADNALINQSKIYIKINNGQKALESLTSILKNYKNRETIDDAYYLVGKIYLEDKKLRNIETTRFIYKNFIKKSKSGDLYFKDSPLLPIVKKDLSDLEQIFFYKKQ